MTCDCEVNKKNIPRELRLLMHVVTRAIESACQKIADGNVVESIDIIRLYLKDGSNDS